MTSRVRGNVKTKTKLQLGKSIVKVKIMVKVNQVIFETEQFVAKNLKEKKMYLRTWEPIMHLFDILDIQFTVNVLVILCPQS